MARGKAALQQVALTKNQLAALKEQTLVQLRVLDGIFATLKTLIRASVVVSAFYFLYLSVEALAGRYTSATLSAILDVGMSKGAAWAIALLATGGYVNERRLRHRTAKELGPYASKLEQKLDPGRSGSRLTQTGEPRKEDKDA